jgi:hypothetical protein
MGQKMMMMMQNDVVVPHVYLPSMFYYIYYIPPLEVRFVVKKIEIDCANFLKALKQFKQYITVYICIYVYSRS